MPALLHLASRWMTSCTSTVHSLGTYASTTNTPTYQTVVHNLAVHGDIETQVLNHCA